MAKRYKCPYCDERHERNKLIDHVEDVHEDLIPENQTPTQVVFNSINKKTHGTCVVCKKPTKWNEKAGKYNRLCDDPRCREKLRKEFKENAVNARGTYNFAADPEFQQKMLKGRKISSTYKFTDGGKVDYVGSYEKKFLEFIDKVMNIESKDIMAPGPTIAYVYDGKVHYWITDFYYIPANLVLDIKDGGNNPNTRPMEEYRKKQDSKESAIVELEKYNYLRLTDNNFSQFMEILAELKIRAIDPKEYKKGMVTRIHENIIEEATKSTIDKTYKNKGKKNLSSFKKVHITESVINKYKKEYPFLKHVRCKDTKEYICDGYIWFDKNDLVAMVGSCEYTDDKTKWIVSLEITKNYKGYGLSKQIVDYAVKYMNCKYLSVNKNNEVAKKVYDDYGFKVYQESETMYYMTIDKNVNESYIEESVSTVPPQWATDANVMIANTMAGERVHAISSLDFNSSILIDDDELGITKIDKEEFKEKYGIEEQFLYPKNEKYYKLLEAVKNNDDCIYKGIYCNLTSFDNVYTEDQIYFDKDFKKLQNKGVDQNILDLSKRIEKVNNVLELDINDESIGITLPKMDLDSEYEVESILKDGKPTTRIKIDNSVIATFDKTAKELSIDDYNNISEAVDILKGGI